MTRAERAAREAQRVGVAGAVELDERAAVALDRDDARRVVVEHLDARQAGPGAEVRERVVGVGRGRAAPELDHDVLRVLAPEVVARADADADRDEPVVCVERDRPGDRVEARVGGDVEEDDLARDVVVEEELDDDRVPGRDRHRQLDEQLVVEAGVDAGQIRERRRLEHDGAPIFVRRAGLDRGDVDARRVVVAHRQLDVADGDAVELRVGGDDGVLDDDDAVAFRARVELDASSTSSTAHT